MSYEPLPPHEFGFPPQITLVGTLRDDPEDAVWASGAYALLTAVTPQFAGTWVVDQRNVLRLDR